MGVLIDVEGPLVIAVLTYKRNDDLSELLPMLVDQAARVITAAGPARLLVVDNDPRAGARSVVARHPAIDYVHEPQPGISAGRNRALREACGSSLLVFIDDDERPVGDWLERLCTAYVRHGRPAAVFGPVVSVFSEPLDDWVAAGSFFRRRRMPTGTEVTVGATNNMLLDLGRVHAHRLGFDDASGLTGGEDTLFTVSLARMGERMVWCDEALVHDVVPVSRATRSWVLQRAFSSGNSWSLITLRLEPHGFRRSLTRIGLVARGAVRLAGGAGRAVLGLLIRSRVHQARGLRTLCRGLGLVSGSIGYRYAEYGRES